MCNIFSCRNGKVHLTVRRLYCFTEKVFFCLHASLYFMQMLSIVHFSKITGVRTILFYIIILDWTKVSGRYSRMSLAWAWLTFAVYYIDSVERRRRSHPIVAHSYITQRQRWAHYNRFFLFSRLEKTRIVPQRTVPLSAV